MHGLLFFYFYITHILFFPPRVNKVFIHSFIHLFIHSFIHSCMYSFIHPSIHPSTHPFIHLFIYSLHQYVILELQQFPHTTVTFMTTIVVIIFCNLTLFQYRFESPQAKQNLISIINILVQELLQNLSNNLKTQVLRRLRNIIKISNVGGVQPSVQSPFWKTNFNMEI